MKQLVPPAPTASASRPRGDLSDSESRFRRIAESIPSITWTADSLGRVRYVNDRWFRYTGLAADTDVHHGPSSFVHPDDAEPVEIAWKHAVQTGADHWCEARLRRHDGTYRWFEVRAVAQRDAAGKVLEWFGTTTDIDDRKRAEDISTFMSQASAELAQLSDSRASLVRIAEMAVPAFADWCGIFLRDEHGNVQRLTLANRDPDKVAFLHAMRDRYPYRDEDSIGPGKVLRTGETCWGHMNDAMLEGFAHDAEHLALLKRVNFRSWVCAPIRLERRIGGAMSFVMSDSGRDYSDVHVAVAEDLAHRVSLAIENNELVAALRDEARRKDEFLAMLAQELRSPLDPIRNAVQVLRARKAATPETHWAHEVIDRQVQILSRLLDDLLDAARVGKGKIELKRESIALSTAINGAVETCRPSIDQARHQMSVSIPFEAIQVDADLTRLTQVFSNLINNAAKYTGLGGQIWVVVSREGAEAVVRVRDTGIGIAPDRLEHIFEPFTQIDRGPGLAQSGLGLGLTLARQLAQMHGGSLEAHSDGLGHGAEFVVRLPAAERAQ